MVGCGRVTSGDESSGVTRSLTRHDVSRQRRVAIVDKEQRRGSHLLSYCPMMCYCCAVCFTIISTDASTDLATARGIELYEYLYGGEILYFYRTASSLEIIVILDIKY